MEVSKAFEEENIISYLSLNYSVKVQKFHQCHEIKILQDVSGIMRGGMNAIMGPSGGGKTSLLNLLAGRMVGERMKGDVMLNGKDLPCNFKYLCGFVTQDDIVMGTLTVRENLLFSANLRLPKVISKEEKERKVEETIYELGLQSCADTKVGTALMRGISGGERKRTNIGMELIISPKVLFLDEPTTGLDSSTANAVMHLLKTISQRGKTIIFSIHQPRYNIFKLFDSMLLLSSGRVIYHGPSSSILDFFQEIGYECEEHNNPSDFILDIANGDSTAARAHKGIEEKFDKFKSKNEFSESLSREFKNSEISKSLKMELDGIELFHKNNRNEVLIRNKFKCYTSFFTQIFYLSTRIMKNIIRNPSSLFLHAITVIVYGIVVGILYFQLGNDAESAIQNRSGLIFFLVCVQVFRNTASIELFLSERNIVMHEVTSGFYTVSAYFFTKAFFDILPIKIVLTTLLSLISYFMTGLQICLPKFIFFYLTLCLAALSSTALTFAICTSSRSISTAHVKLNFSFIFMELFGGYLRNVKTMPPWLSWLQYVSIFRYSLNALFINELKDLKIYRNSTEVVDAGRRYLQTQGIRHETAWDLWQNNFFMFIITIGFLIIAYLQLRTKLNNN